MIFLENEFLKATFSELGAELVSLINKKNNKEIMWQADSSIWAGTSPVLFPIVGGLKNNCYKYFEKEYALNRHGFARRILFTIKEKSELEITFQLSNNADTEEFYPFEFILEIKYSISNNQLKTEYLVFNPSEKELLFSLGAHPGFNIEVNETINYNDYYIEFENDNILKPHPLVDNLISLNSYDIHLENQKLSLSYELFAKDALVMTDMKSQKLILANNKNNQQLIFQFSNFPFFGIWAAKNANFVCLEPWQGIADFENHNGNIENKIGIINLNGKTNWSAEWSIEIK